MENETKVRLWGTMIPRQSASHINLATRTLITRKVVRVLVCLTKTKMKEVSIKTKNPVVADNLLQQFGVLMEGGGKNDASSYAMDKNGNYKARVLSGDVGFVKFAISNQGYLDIEIVE